MSAVRRAPAVFQQAVKGTLWRNTGFQPVRPAGILPAGAGPAGRMAVFRSKMMCALVVFGLPGYDGIKTGSTPSAGSRLVASGHLGDRHLHVAVLGSTTDAGRYVDTRNLFRWAWRQVGAK